MHPQSTSRQGGSGLRARSTSSTARAPIPRSAALPINLDEILSARSSPGIGQGAATLVGSGQASLSRELGATSYSAGLVSPSPTFNFFQPDHQRSNSLPTATRALESGSGFGTMAYGADGGSEGMDETWMEHGSGDGGDDFGGPLGVMTSAGSLGALAPTSPQHTSSDTTSRLSRIAAEQRRRNDLQDSFRRLSDVLPSSSERTSKKAILDRAVTTITDLRQANQALVKKLASYEERSPGGLSSASSLGDMSPSSPDLSFFSQVSPGHPPLRPVPHRSDDTSFVSGVSHPFATQSRYLHQRSPSSLPHFSFDPTQLPSYKGGTGEEG